MLINSNRLEKSKAIRFGRAHSHSIPLPYATDDLQGRYG